MAIKELKQEEEKIFSMFPITVLNSFCQEQKNLRKYNINFHCGIEGEKESERLILKKLPF